MAGRPAVTTEELMRRLLELERQIGGWPPNTPAESRRHIVNGHTGRIANSGSGVTARSGTTVGSGTVTIYKLVGTTLTSTGITVTAYNLSATAVPSSTYIQLKFAAGKWWVDMEDCP